MMEILTHEPALANWLLDCMRKLQDNLQDGDMVGQWFSEIGEFIDIQSVDIKKEHELLVDIQNDNFDAKKKKLHVDTVADCKAMMKVFRYFTDVLVQENKKEKDKFAAETKALRSQIERLQSKNSELMKENDLKDSETEENLKWIRGECAKYFADRDSVLQTIIEQYTRFQKFIAEMLENPDASYERNSLENENGEDQDLRHNEEQEPEQDDDEDDEHDDDRKTE